MISGRTAVQRGWRRLPEHVRCGPLSGTNHLGPASRADCLLQYLFTNEERLSAGIGLADLTSATRDVSRKRFTIGEIAVPAPDLIEERVAGAAITLEGLAEFLQSIRDLLTATGYFENRNNKDDRLYTQGTKRFFCEAQNGTVAERARHAADIADLIARLSQLSPAALQTAFADPDTIARLEADLDDVWARRIPAPRAAKIGKGRYEDASETYLEELRSWIERSGASGALSGEDAVRLRSWTPEPTGEAFTEPILADAYDAALLAWLGEVGYSGKRDPTITADGTLAWNLAIRMDAPLTLLTHLSGYGLAASRKEDHTQGEVQTEDADLVKPSIADDEPRVKGDNTRKRPLDRSIYRRLQPFLKGVDEEWVNQVPTLRTLLTLEVGGAAAPLALRTAEARAALSAGALLYRDVVTHLEDHPGVDDLGMVPTLGASGATHWARNHIGALLRTAKEGEGLSERAGNELADPTRELTAELWKSIHNADYRRDRLSDPLNVWREVSGAVTSLTRNIRQRYKDRRDTGVEPPPRPILDVVREDPTGTGAIAYMGQVAAPPVAERVLATADHVIDELDVPKFWEILLSKEGEILRPKWDQAFSDVKAGISPKALGAPEFAATWEELIDFVNAHKARYA